MLRMLHYFLTQNQYIIKMLFTAAIIIFQCNNGGCLIELAQQLAVIMVGKQIINNAQEILIPKVKAWWHNKKVRQKQKQTNK